MIENVARVARATFGVGLPRAGRPCHNKGGSCERCCSFDFGGMGEARPKDYGRSGGVAAEVGAEEEYVVDAAAAGVVFVCSGVGSEDYAGALDRDAGACDGCGSSGASV